MKVLSLSRDVFKAKSDCDVIVSIRIDNDNRLFHIMDLDNSGDCKLGRAISEEFLRDIVETYKLTLGHKGFEIKDYEDYVFLIYLIDGSVTIWCNGSLKPFCDSQSMYEGFRIVSEDRRRTN